MVHFKAFSPKYRSDKEDMNKFLKILKPEEIIGITVYNDDIYIFYDERRFMKHGAL